MGSDAGAGNPLDWNDVRFFLALARARTLAKAATALGVDQTTVGRRIAALEGRLGIAVLERTPHGLDVTLAGKRILDAAERMNEAAVDLSAQLATDQAPCSGTVTVATSESLAEHFIIPAVDVVRSEHPHMTVILRTGWARVDLRRGEADLAVRLVRPRDPRLACRKLAEFSLRLYASSGYIARHGVPRSLQGRALIGYEDALRMGGSVFTSLRVDGGSVALQSNSGRVLLAAAIAGLGIAQLPSYVGEAAPDLTPVLPEHDKAYAVWLVLPDAKRRVASVRAVSDAIAGAFRHPPRAGGADRAAE
jgi:DNA-binding transcriptional LysR family regulator